MAVLNDFTLVLAWSLQVNASRTSPMSVLVCILTYWYTFSFVFSGTEILGYHHMRASVEQCWQHGNTAELKLNAQLLYAQIKPTHASMAYETYYCRCCCTRADQEAARYLETYKAYEQKSAESIQEKVGRTRTEHSSSSLFYTSYIHR